MTMPYARLVQAMRVSAEMMVEEERAELRRAAFIGWQAYIIQPSYEKHPKPKKTLDKWLRQFGLHDRSARVESNADIVKRANAVVERILKRTSPNEKKK